jgi:two-component system OmpR family response regulator
MDRYHHTFEYILIVEDDPQVGPLLEELLAEEGYRAGLVTTVAGAHARLSEGGIDLVLCDLLLPDGNARHSLRSRSPCLFMAGHPVEMQHLIDEGSHYLAKPFSRDQLLKAIRDCLDRGKCSSPAQLAV